MRYIYGFITGYVLCLFVNLYGHERLIDSIMVTIERVRDGF